MRYAFIANSLLSDTFDMNDWFADPYDNTFKSGVLMNKSEQQIYDAQFPQHPLTKARQLIAEIEKSIQWRPAINTLETFDK